MSARRLDAAVFVGALLAAGLGAGASRAAPKAPPVGARDNAPLPARVVDRVVVRWHAPETGGIVHPQFVFERELAFEAQVEALADPDPEGGGFRERHVRAALDRHIAETLLSSLSIVPPPTDRELAARVVSARAILDQRVRGHAHLLEAAAHEGISADEIDAMLVRQAKASLYLDRMVAPMLEPSEVELRDLWKAGTTPFKEMPYDAARPLISRWLIGQRVSQAIDTYYQNARSRVVVAISRHAP